MAFTTVTAWAVAQRVKAAALNLLVTAIQELQSVVHSTPFVHVTNTTAVTNGSNVQYNAVVADTHSGWDSTNKRYAVPKTGYYYVIASVQPTTAVGVAPNIYVNGSTRIAAGYVTNIASGSGAVTGVISVSAGDLITVREAGSSYTPANAVTNYLQLRYMGAP